MYTIILLLIFSALLIWYNCSERVKFQERPQWLERLTEQKKICKLFSGFILLISLILICLVQGIGAGIFAWFIYIMGILCMLVLFSPYQILKRNHIFLIVMACLVLEISFTYLA